MILSTYIRTVFYALVVFLKKVGVNKEGVNENDIPIRINGIGRFCLTEYSQPKGVKPKMGELTLRSVAPWHRA